MNRFPRTLTHGIQTMGMYGVAETARRGRNVSRLHDPLSKGLPPESFEARVVLPFRSDSACFAVLRNVVQVVGGIRVGSQQVLIEFDVDATTASPSLLRSLESIRSSIGLRDGSG